MSIRDQSLKAYMPPISGVNIIKKEMMVSKALQASSKNFIRAEGLFHLLHSLVNFHIVPDRITRVVVYLLIYPVYVK